MDIEHLNEGGFDRRELRFGELPERRGLTAGRTDGANLRDPRPTFYRITPRPRREMDGQWIARPGTLGGERNHNGGSYLAQGLAVDDETGSGLALLFMPFARGQADPMDRTAV